MRERVRGGSASGAALGRRGLRGAVGGNGAGDGHGFARKTGRRARRPLRLRTARTTRTARRTTRLAWPAARGRGGRLRRGGRDGCALQIVADRDPRHLPTRLVVEAAEADVSNAPERQKLAFLHPAGDVTGGVFDECNICSVIPDRPAKHQARLGTSWSARPSGSSWPSRPRGSVGPVAVRLTRILAPVSREDAPRQQNAVTLGHGRHRNRSGLSCRGLGGGRLNGGGLGCRGLRGRRNAAAESGQSRSQ